MLGGWQSESPMTCRRLPGGGEDQLFCARSTQFLNLRREGLSSGANGTGAQTNEGESSTQNGARVLQVFRCPVGACDANNTCLQNRCKSASASHLHMFSLIYNDWNYRKTFKTDTYTKHYPDSVFAFLKNYTFCACKKLGIGSRNHELSSKHVNSLIVSFLADKDLCAEFACPDTQWLQLAVPLQSAPLNPSSAHCGLSCPWLLSWLYSSCTLEFHGDQYYQNSIRWLSLVGLGSRFLPSVPFCVD